MFFLLGPVCLISWHSPSILCDPPPNSRTISKPLNAHARGSMWRDVSVFNRAPSVLGVSWGSPPFQIASGKCICPFPNCPHLVECGARKPAGAALVYVQHFVHFAHLCFQLRWGGEDIWWTGSFRSMDVASDYRTSMRNGWRLQLNKHFLSLRAYWEVLFALFRPLFVLCVCFKGGRHLDSTSSGSSSRSQSPLLLSPAGSQNMYNSSGPMLRSLRSALLLTIKHVPHNKALHTLGLRLSLII